MTLERSISPSPFYQQFTGPVTKAQIAALCVGEVEAIATGLEMLVAGNVTLTRPDNTSVTLTGLPAGWARAIQFTEITATTSTGLIVYRSTLTGLR